MRPLTWFAVAVILTVAGGVARADAPHAVSPGSPDRFARAGERCPTFSWSAVPQALAVHLVVFDATDETADPRLVVHVALPPAVSSWTPSLEQCLLPGRRYAWRVGAVDGEGEAVWSEPAWFEVEPPLAEVPSAWVEQLRERLSVTPPPTGATTGGSVATPRVPLPAATATAAAKTASLFSVGNGGAVTAGAVTADSFAGDGSALVNVDAVTLQGNAPSAFAPAVHLHDDRYFTQTQLATGGQATVHWQNLTGVPAGFADGIDNDTTYTAGYGLTLTKIKFSLAGADNTRPGHVVTTVDNTGDVGQYASLAVGTDGFALISYYDATNGDLKVAHCNDLACTSATITTLDSAGNVGRYCSLTIGADGLPLISYYDVTKGDLKVAHCSNPQCSTATISTVDVAVAGLSTSITIGADGLGLISYYDLFNRDLKVAHCGNTECSTATISTLDSTDDVGRFTSITIGGDGLGLISYYDVTNGNLKVAHCNDLACTSATTTTLDSPGDVGWYSSITTGADGLGYIAYYDATNGDLKAARCTNANCSSAWLGIVENVNDSGQHAAMAIGADGLPLIAYSYNDPGGGEVRVVHCRTPECWGRERVSLVLGNSGEVILVTIGADGLPVIGYSESGSNSLKVIHCSNSRCAPHLRPR